MRKIKARFFTIADYEEEETWLRKQHRSGLRLVKMILPFLYQFEECEPEDAIYRLDYKNGRQEEDYLQMFRDYGWEYLGTSVGWLYFRKEAKNVRREHEDEIFSDAESRADMLRHVVRTRMMPVLIVFLCCVVPNWSLVAMQDIHSGWDVSFAILMTVLTALYLYLIVHCGTKLRRLQAKCARK